MFTISVMIGGFSCFNSINKATRDLMKRRRIRKSTQHTIRLKGIRKASNSRRQQRRSSWDAPASVGRSGQQGATKAGAEALAGEVIVSKTPIRPLKRPSGSSWVPCANAALLQKRVPKGGNRSPFPPSSRPGEKRFACYLLTRNRH